MSTYPRPGNWNFRPAPKYHEPLVSPKPALYFLIGVVAGGFLLSHLLKPHETPTIATKAPVPTATSTIPPAKPAELPQQAPAPTFRKDPSPHTFSGTAGIAMDFAPRATSERLTDHLIRNAQKDIKLQAFHLKAPSMQAALREALQRHVKVDILVDQTINKESKTILDALKKAGANIHVNARSGAHHDKTIIMDGKDVLVGSINYSRDTKDLDFTNVMVISNPEVANIYLEHWNSHLPASKSR